jgi:uncharacterized protein (TIGR02145 family)
MYQEMKTFVFFASLLLLTGCSKEFIRYHNHKYKVIGAGDQYWMAENLVTKSYRNGKKIPLITDYDVWPEMTTPGCGYYNNDTSKLRKYGMLYNWYAVDGGKLCPAGWRVPSHEDWLKLEKFYGGNKQVGGKMKAVSGWKGRHVSGDDFGFKALPGGYRLNEDFLEGWEAIWWTTSVANASYFQDVKPTESYLSLVASNTYIWGRKISYTGSDLITTLNLRENGFSVRCVRVKPANSKK